MKLAVSKKLTRLEVKNADAINAMAEMERAQKIAARQKWREVNCERIGWQMFLSIWGPDSDWYKTCTDSNADQDPVEAIAEIAYSEQFRTVLAHFDCNGNVDYSRLKGFDGAFAFLVNEFHNAIRESDLICCYLSKYGSDLDLPAKTPLATLCRSKIEADGLEWLQLAPNDEMQQEIEEELFGEFLSKNFMMDHYSQGVNGQSR